MHPSPGQTWTLSLAVLVVLSACGAGTDPDEGSASTSSTVAASCEDPGAFSIDLDGDGTDEKISAASDGRSSTVAICDDDMKETFEVEGTNVEIVGIRDIGADGSTELLFNYSQPRGTALGAIQLTSTGLQMTDLSVLHWSDRGEADAPPFGGASYQCTDYDEDGTDDLAYWRFRPESTGQVAIETSIITLDGIEPVFTQVDEFVTSIEQAEALWSMPSGCDPP